MSAFIPSPQQQAVFDWVRTGTGSARLDAVAGAGKTTTLVHAVLQMQGFVAFTAYNKKIADDIGAKLAAMGADPRRVDSGTFHSFGFRAWRKVAPQVKLEEKKLTLLLAALDPRGAQEPLYAFAREAVSLAKQRAIGVLCPVQDSAAWYGLVHHFELEELLATAADVPSAPGMEQLVADGLGLAQRLLQASVEANPRIVDFDDMIYAPLVHNVKLFPRDWVLVDEAQDTNPARRALAKKLLKPGGRLLAVGDPRQAIYGFTGADNDAMDIIAHEFGCTTLPLTTTYRCPKAVVQHAQQWVQHIHAAPTAPEGRVVTMDDATFRMTTPAPTDVVLCRNTKPLVELAYHYIKRHVACHVEGRDIGRGLLALAGRWRVQQLDALERRLTDYLQRETERFLAKGQETKAASLTDRVDTLRVIMQALKPGSTVNDLRQEILALFQDSEGAQRPTLTLSTVHKAKGREWDTVYLYGRNRYMPSKFARQDWQLAQEDNLIYVAITRAKQVLVEVVVELPKPKKDGAA